MTHNHDLYSPIIIVHNMNSSFLLKIRAASFPFDSAPSTDPTGSTVSSMLGWETCKVVAIDATIGFGLEKKLMTSYFKDSVYSLGLIPYINLQS